MIKCFRKKLTLDDILYRRSCVLLLVETFGLDIPDDAEGNDFRRLFERYKIDESCASNYYFAEELRKGLNRYMQREIEVLDA